MQTVGTLPMPLFIMQAFSACAVYYSQIRKIESHVIDGHEEYSIVAFHLNAEGMILFHDQAFRIKSRWSLGVK